MAIPNGSPGTAIDLVLPTSVVLDTSLIAPDVAAWYRISIAAARYALSMRVTNTTAEFPYLSLLESDAVTPVTTPGFADSGSPSDTNVTPLTTYYVTLTPDGAATAIATLSLKEAPYRNAVIGDLIVPGAQATSPTAYIISQVDGTILRSLPWQAVFAGGPWMSPSGKVLTDAAPSSDPFQLISGADFLTFGTVARPDGSTIYCIRHDKVNHWYVVRSGGANGPKVYTISETGTATLKATLTGTVVSIGSDVSVGGHKLYYTNLTAGTGWAVKVWNLDTDLAAADFVAGVVNCRWNWCLVLSDDTVLVSYFNPADRTLDFVRRYNSAGVAQADYAVQAGFTSAGVMFLAADDPLSFWWIAQKITGFFYQQNFRRISIATGLDATNFTLDENANGYGDPAASEDFRVANSSVATALTIDSTVTAATTTSIVRCERIFLLPSSPTYKRMFFKRLEFLIQQGVGISGSGQGSDPQMLIQISRDGGRTWGPEIWLSMGKIGDYLHRSFKWNLGYYRHGAVKVVITDPVFVALLGADGLLEEGLS